MRKAATLATIILLCAGGAAAACDAEARVEQRRLQTEHASTDKDLKRAATRLKAQERRLAALDGPTVEPAPPPAPVGPAAGFEENGKVALDCDDPEAVVEALAFANDGLIVFQGEVTDFAAAVASREDQVAALEDAAEAERNETPGEDEAEPRTAEGEGEGDGTAETPQDGDEQSAPETAEGDGAPTEEDEPKVAAEDEGEGDDEATGPLAQENNPLVFQRVLTLPDSKIAAEPGADDGEATPPFTVLYVFERRDVAGSSWARVGRSPLAEPEGWIDEERALRWDSALVMQFTPRGKRNRVLFFNEARDLTDVVTGFQFSNEAKGFYADLKAGELKDERFVAAEPPTAVDYAAEPYLLPIVDHVEEIFDDGTPTTLVKVASVSLQTAELKARDDDSLNRGEEEPKSLEGFKIGVAFVIDATASMGPYIQRTRDTVKAFYDALDGVSSDVAASFGLVAYRDDFSHDPKVEYVTEIVQTLDPDASARSVLANISSVKPSPAPTVDWREDAYAGVAEALESFDWEEYDARLLILITDAGAREGSDKLAFRKDMTTESVAQAAEAKRVAILPVHLITKEAEALGAVAPAQAQYRVLGGRTGDTNSSKYLAVDARDRSAFTREIESAAREIARQIRDQAVQQAETPEPPKVNDGFITSDQPEEGSEAPKLGKLIANEILRARLEFLGAGDDVAAPSFVSGWATNVDLVDPSLETLQFSVFLTRNQINALAQSVQVLLDAFVAAETSPGAFFDQLQLVAAKTAADPSAVRADERAAVKEILPAFLADLPYRSPVLRLDRGLWDAFGQADRERFVDDLRDKLKIYSQLYEQTENWVDFGAGDPALDAYPVALERLP